jgi:hypothetical protein
MSERINHVAVWVAAIVYYLFGWLWFTVFGSVWLAAMGGSHPMPSPTVYVLSFLTGLILSYAAAVALGRHPEDQTARQGVSFALFMGIALFASQTYNIALYSGTNSTLWFIDTGYVVVGFAIIGAIVGGWKKKAASAA